MKVGSGIFSVNFLVAGMGSHKRVKMYNHCIVCIYCNRVCVQWRARLWLSDEQSCESVVAICMYTA